MGVLRDHLVESTLTGWLAIVEGASDQEEFQEQATLEPRAVVGEYPGHSESWGQATELMLIWGTLGQCWLGG